MQLIAIAAAAAAPALIGAGATVTTIGGIAITTGTLAAIGLSVAASALSFFIQSAMRDEPEMSRERQQSIRESAAVRVMSFGTVRRAPDTHLIYDVSDGDSFLRLVALNHGPIESIEQHLLGSEVVSLDGSDFVTGSTDGRYDDKVRIDASRLGSATQAAVSGLAGIYAPWSSDHRALGVALALIEQTPVAPDDAQARHLHREIPYRSTFKAANDIYDPRDGSTGWSDNAALVALWHARHADGLALADGDIDMDSFATAADACDESVALKAGGTEARYRANGSIRLDEDPMRAFRGLLRNMDATHYLTSAGELAVRVGDPALSADLTFTADHVLATEFRAGPRSIDRRNRVVARLVSEEHEYEDITAPAQELAASVAAYGARTERLDLPFCPHHRQAQRLAKKELLRLNPDEVGTITTTAVGAMARPGDVCKLNFDGAETDADLRVLSVEIGDDGLTATLDVQSIDPGEADSAWAPDVDENDLSDLPALNSDGSILGDPAGVSGSGVAVDLNAAVTGVALKVEWTNPGDPKIKAEIRWRAASTSTYRGPQVVSAADGETETPPLPDGTDWVGEVRFIGPSGSATDWVSTGTVTLSASTAAPLTPTLDGPSSAETFSRIDLQVGVPDVSNYWRIKIYKNTANDFATAFLLLEAYPARGSDATISVSASSSIGTDYFWAVAESTSRVDSSESSVHSVTITSSP